MRFNIEGDDSDFGMPAVDVGSRIVVYLLHEGSGHQIVDSRVVTDPQFVIGGKRIRVNVELELVRSRYIS